MDKIPRIIHYCWFGMGEMPKLAKSCIESWKRHLKDYEFVLWNEENFDVNSHPFTKSAYEAKKYAFVTDYVRLYVLYNFGGIYMDTDVEVIRNIDPFLRHSAFSGFESNNIVPTGIMGAEKGHKLIRLMLNYYDDKAFCLIPNTAIISELLEKYGLKRNGQYQVIGNELDFHFYPRDYFCPIDYNSGKNYISSNTYTIHHFAGSWLSPMHRIKNKARYALIKSIGEENFNRIKKMLKH
jgi:mannosyltransferase OCH1-like enzyme